jgi:hypothetical protein
MKNLICSVYFTLPLLSLKHCYALNSILNLFTGRYLSKFKIVPQHEVFHSNEKSQKTQKFKIDMHTYMRRVKRPTCNSFPSKPKLYVIMCACIIMFSGVQRRAGNQVKWSVSWELKSGTVGNHLLFLELYDYMLIC